MAPEKKDGKSEMPAAEKPAADKKTEKLTADNKAKMTTAEKNAEKAVDGLRPEDHRRPPKRDMPYPLSSYGVIDGAKILAQRHKVLAASLVSSLCTQVMLYPFDSLKTRMQVGSITKAFELLGQISRTEGLRKGLYRGLLGPTITYSGVRVATFGWYSNMRYNIDDFLYKLTGRSILQEVNTPGSYPTFLSTAGFTTAGGVTGFGVAFLACPFEMIKIGMQSAAGEKSAVGKQSAGVVAKGPAPWMDQKLCKEFIKRGTVGNLVALYRRDGIGGPYAGIRYHIMRDCIGNGIFWGSYEGVKQVLSTSAGLTPDSRWGPLAGAAAGGVCSLFSYVCGYPIDTAKAVFQNRHLFMQGGAGKPVPIRYMSKASFAGMPVTMLMVGLRGGLNMGGFELMKAAIRGLDINPPPPRTKEGWEDPYYRDY